jgi:hypothetical protein
MKLVRAKTCRLPGIVWREGPALVNQGIRGEVARRRNGSGPSLSVIL